MDFRYGPLIYVTAGMDEDQGNYYWNGLPPVDYDADGIPVDQNGMQCLDISCPLHPSYTPQETEYSLVLGTEIPTIAHYREWFEENFLAVSDNQIKRWIIKRWSSTVDRAVYGQVLRNYSSIEELKEAVWPQDAQT